ncbi:MAG TPA: small acid-soluble spore protein Tlp [Ruminococcaceae bacterium]|jgi:small acid-soluble spore protein (thioredoxin-like protein)|nr:small acid-soluble spore protein Tlp [Oscillospiraceae bacterium]HCA29823.1 small acid-soluble spore protein Tlp [Oscillospiraceae bacterium]
MKRNPDDRRDNVEKIQYNINHTIENMELAEEMIEKTDDPKTRRDLKKKNERRKDALDGMRNEIQDEAAHQEKL